MNLGLILPELTLLVFAIAVILVDLITQKKGVLVWVSLFGIVVSAGFALGMWGWGAYGCWSVSGCRVVVLPDIAIGITGCEYSNTSC